jgi:hypothetical protein
MHMGRFFAGMGLACVLLSSCKDENPPGSPSDIVFPPSNVSYERQVQPLFNQTCTFAGCHDDGQAQGKLKLTSYSNTVFSLPGVVVPGKPESSTLVLRIQGSVGTRMPPDRNQLNDNQINGIRTWIAEGAKDD